MNETKKLKDDYKTVDGYSLYDKIYVLDHYDVRETYIKKIYDDYYSDESDYITKYVDTEYGSHRLEDVYCNERDAEYGVQNKKDLYDAYVTSRY